MKVRKHDITLDLWYEMILTDIKTGKIVKRKSGRCYSFTGWFVKILRMFFAGGGTNLDFTSYLGEVRSGNSGLYGYYNAQTMRINSSANDDTFGVVVGTGTNSPAITNYQLASRILHGTSAGQLQHSAVTFGAPATLTGQTTFIATRVFTNASGGSITVKEIGLVAESLNINQASTHGLLIARDVVPDTVIANGLALTLNYTLRTDV